MTITDSQGRIRKREMTILRRNADPQADTPDAEQFRHTRSNDRVGVTGRGNKDGNGVDADLSDPRLNKRTVLDFRIRELRDQLRYEVATELGRGAIFQLEP